MGVLRVPPLWRPANRIEPVVLPFAPRTGWLSADRRRAGISATDTLVFVIDILATT